MNMIIVIVMMVITVATVFGGDDDVVVVVKMINAATILDDRIRCNDEPSLGAQRGKPG